MFLAKLYEKYFSNIRPDDGKQKKNNDIMILTVHPFTHQPKLHVWRLTIPELQLGRKTTIVFVKF